MKKLSKTYQDQDYKKLIQRIQAELNGLDFLIRSRTAETYWKIGKYIHEHLLKFKERAEYGTKLFEDLEQDVDRDKTTLRKILQFYRAYPIGAAQRQLSWSHYKALIAVKDKDERTKLEREIVRKNWDTDRLQQFLNTRRQIEEVKDDHKPIPQLKAERGILYTYQIVERPTLNPVDRSFIDLGFNFWKWLPSAARFEPSSIVESLKDEDGSYSLKKSDRTKRDLYTFKAVIEKVVDGDTLWVEVDLGFDSWRRQELRLRGIDCPEMDTEEGRRAKTFVLARLKPRDFVVIKTTKDDKYKRMLVDVFYLPGEKDPHAVAKEGVFLNQELLNNRLAVLWKSR